MRPITIIGGGLAGLTLGIGLRQRGVPVVICEAGRYPRHRVCGEFISGNGLAVLDRLGLRGLFEKAGAVNAHTAQFTAGANQSPVRTLPVPALCLSRYLMDAVLAAEFRRLGGELQENTRRTPSNGEGIVQASGRHVKTTEHGWRWFGMKVHARGLELAADLEMHLSNAGYVGINRINDGEVNVCGLFRTQHRDPQLKSRFELLRGKPGSSLHNRLASASFDDSSFCSVAALPLAPQRARSREECCIGDTLTMIPPVTGNGMSMAFESAEIAIEPATQYSRNEIDWQQARQSIARLCDEVFAQRLAWARWVQWLMFSPLLLTGAGSILLRSGRLWQFMYNRTR